MIRKTTAYLVLLLLLAANATAQDDPVFIPAPAQPVQDLSAYIKLLNDPGKTWQIADLLANPKKFAFNTLSSSDQVDPHSVLWARLLISPGFSSDSFYIGLPHQNRSGLSQGNDKADVWIIQNGTIIQHYETGTLTPFDKRPRVMPINHNLFPVALREGKPFIIYWRLQRTMNFDVLQTNFFLQHASVTSMNRISFDKLAWFYTGMMFILFVFGLVFLVITREHPFIWFSAIAAVLVIHMQLLEPENNLTRLFFPQHPGFQFPLFVILTTMFGILILQFIRSFARIKQLLPVWDRYILYVMAYITLLAIATVVCMLASPETEVSLYFSLFAFLLNIIIAVRLIITQNLYARWSGFALLWLFFFQVLGALWNNGLLPESFPNPWVIAQGGMMSILFFTLAYRFKRTAKEKAEAAKVLEMDAIKTRFFANISHEFRTPLTLMLGPLDQLEDGALDEPQKKKYIGMMRRNGERLLQLINQLLDLSKLESGKMELEVAKTDITGLLKAIAGSFESMAEQNQVNYHVHFPEENLIGFCDRDKLEKIVVNLLSNAFRFTPVNGMVTFSVEHDAKRLRFTVQDNGAGMPKTELNNIFNRFHQVTGTQGGTGIGLSLTKELLQLHKGQISVQSESGKGSSFRVSIPTGPESYAADEIKTASPAFTEYQIDPVNYSAITETEQEIHHDTSLPLILVAEDNADLQQYISDTLLPHFQVRVAANGELALQDAIAMVPDCIVSDVMMPVMDGIEFCNQVKQETATSHIPVILLTAKAGSQSRIEGLQTGADDYMVKPFDGKELIVRIHNLIEQRRKLRDRYSRQVISVEPEAVTVTSTEQEFIVEVRRAIEDNIDNEQFGVAELAGTVHFSRSQLHRKLKTLTGQSPNELIRNYRLERALQLLQQQGGNVTEIAFKTGFSSAAYFSKCFSDRFGYPPSEVEKTV